MKRKIMPILRAINENELLAANLIIYALKAAERFFYFCVVLSILFSFRADISTLWMQETTRAGHFIQTIADPIIDSAGKFSTATTAVPVITATAKKSQEKITGKAANIVDFESIKKVKGQELHQPEEKKNRPEKLEWWRNMFN